MFGTIVLAIDGSRPSDRAFDYAGRLAKESGSRIVAIHVKEIMAGRAADSSTSTRTRSSRRSAGRSSS